MKERTLRFDLNVSLVLNDEPFVRRFDHAARLGFDAVEFWWPRGEQRPALIQAIRDAGLKVASFNLDGGDLAAGERGFLCDPSATARFRAHLPVALDLAHGLGARRMTVLVGKVPAGQTRASAWERATELLAWACEQAAAADLILNVEALNGVDTPDYLVTSSEEAIALLRAVGAPNLRYQLDLFHMARMGEDLSAVIARHARDLGHVQVADLPGRHQPGTGTIPFARLFEQLADAGYRDYVGLEYVPCGSVEESLQAWPSDRRGPLPLDRLTLPR